MFLRFARTTPVASLAAGARVVVEGRIEATEVLEVPGTEIGCVYHETSLEEYRRGVRGGRPMWTPTSNEEELSPFWLRDDGEKVLVSPAAGFVKVKGGRRERGQGKRRGVRYVTRYIAVGDVVRVRGVVMESDPPQKSQKKKGKGKKKKQKQQSRAHGTGRLEISGTEKDPLVILFRRTG